MDHFPRLLTPEELALFTMPATTLAMARDQQARVTARRDILSAELDELESAVALNHAHYLAGKPSWSYERRIEADVLIKRLKRQRQVLQESFGRINRMVRRLEIEEGATGAGAGLDRVESQFLRAAERLLDPETFTMLVDLAHESKTSMERKIRERAAGNGGPA